MKNFLNSVVVIGVVAFIGLFVYILWPRQTVPHNFDPIATSTVSAITFETKTITDESVESKYSISAEYPVLTGGIPSATAKMNKMIDYKIKNEVGIFKKNAGEFIAELPEVLKNTDERSFLEIKYTVANDLVSQGVVSIAFPVLYYQLSAAHPGHSSITMNFNATTGELVELKDVFVGDYLETLSAISIEKLTTKLGDESDVETIKNGASPRKENFASFYFTKEGMHLIFNDYQVAPYSAGPQELVIEYAMLKEIIDPKGILSSFK